MKTTTHAGRPKYQPKFPLTQKWTFSDWCNINEINPKTGKGKLCSKVTLNNFKKSDMYSPKGHHRCHSLIVEIMDEFAKSKSAIGRGRKMKLYMLRSKQNNYPKYEEQPETSNVIPTPAKQEMVTP